MIDFRKLSLPHDLRSQLGLKDPVAIAQDLCRAINGEPSVLGDRIIAEQEAMRAEIGEALRIEAKPLSPDNATPDPLHKTIAAMGCSSKTWGMRNALAVNKLFSATGTRNVVVNVVNNGEPRTDQNAAEIVANIRKMIHSPEVQRLRAIGQLTVDQASVGEPGNPIPRDPTHRSLPKVNDCLDKVESDVLELLVLAGANPHTDRRRLDAARTQFELAFMMLKKAVDPEQERE